MTSTASIEVRLSEEDIRLIAEEVAQLIAAGEARPQSPWMSLTTAADYLDWSVHRVYKLAASDEIPHRKHRGRLAFRADELDRWLDQFERGPFAQQKPRKGL